MENLEDSYYALSKVELHRHLEGSLRLKTMLEIARAQGITFPTYLGSLSNLVKVQKCEPSIPRQHLFDELKMELI